MYTIKSSIGRQNTHCKKKFKWTKYIPKKQVAKDISISSEILQSSNVFLRTKNFRHGLWRQTGRQ